ncbi:MAG: hypothetical protein II695_12925 [Oscillospiraceae bacterium]|nr:hypothetical protein [Oscillospiraceae bacterium]
MNYVKKFDEKLSDIIASVWKNTRDEQNVRRMHATAKSILKWNWLFMLLSLFFAVNFMLLGTVAFNPRWLSIGGLSSEQYDILTMAAVVYFILVLFIKRICIIIMKSARKYIQK